MKKKNNNTGPGVIAQNKKARHDFFIEKQYQAGIALAGWEVKSLRAKRVQLKESYIFIKNGEIFLFGAHISPLATTSTHTNIDAYRNRKLLLHKREINTLIGMVERRGYTLVALSLYWKTNKVKIDIGLAKGKKQYDKRATQKQRDWERDKARVLKRG